MITKYLQGTPARYSLDKDGKILTWESEKPKPTPKQLEDIKAQMELEETEKKKIPTVEERLEAIEKAIVELQPQSKIKDTLAQIKKVREL